MENLKRRYSEKAILDFLTLVGEISEKIYSTLVHPHYRDQRIESLLVYMLISNIKGNVVTLDDMLEIMSEASSRSTRLRLIESLRDDGHIYSVRKREMECPEQLDETGAKKAFYLSDEIRAALFSELGSVMDEMATLTQKAAK